MYYKSALNLVNELNKRLDYINNLINVTWLLTF